MKNSVSSDKVKILEAWTKGWALARGVAPPVREREGFRTDPDWPEQKRRYVFEEPNAGFKALAHEITDPHIFLKVCAAPEQVKKWLPSRWVIQSPRFLMTCFKPMHKAPGPLPEGYTLHVEKQEAVSVVSILHHNTTVAIGRMVVVGEYTIYDRIETIPEHRRLGLASMVMLKLEELAMDQGGRKGLLVATDEGKRLYENLGWTNYSPYTTAVIPG